MGTHPRSENESLVVTGDAYWKNFEYHRAISAYRTALRSRSNVGIIGTGPVLEKIAAGYEIVGQFALSKQMYERALLIYDKSADTEGCARVYERLGWIIFRKRGHLGVRKANDFLERGLHLLRGSTNSYSAAAIYSHLAWYYGTLDDWTNSRKFTNRALIAAKKSGNIQAYSLALGVKASYLTDIGKIDDGLSLWKRAYDLALKNKNYQEAIFSLYHLCIYHYPRNLSIGRRLALQHLDLCQRVRDEINEARGWARLSELDWLCGRWKDAHSEIKKALKMEERLGIRMRFWIRAVNGRFALSQGKLEEAEVCFKNALDHLSSKIPETVATHLGVGLLRLEQGRENEAATHFEICVNSFRRAEFTTAPLLYIETLMQLTSIYSGQQMLAKAQQTSNWATRIATRLRSNAGTGMALQSLAILKFHDEKAKTSNKLFLECLKEWEKAGWPYYLARGRIAYASTIMSTRGQEARNQLKRAYHTFEKLGAIRDRDRTLTMLTELKA